ncbi:hypothetical protein [Anaerobaca lacustris]|uniref:Uncharacterized protein n=1 Tax=Anaerobaca lacustris TaxID=3044600 RepID=A0AAW6TZL1_9BACT|nr:hypothetical protein [Sedimentisphaerales bacterium M17dextr]
MGKKRQTQTGNGTSVESIRHKDKRLRGFVVEPENAPKRMVYPRAAALLPSILDKAFKGELL